MVLMMNTCNTHPTNHHHPAPIATSRMASLEAKHFQGAIDRRAECKSDAVPHASPEATLRVSRSAMVASPASPDVRLDHKALPEGCSRRPSKSDRLLGYSR